MDEELFGDADDKDVVSNKFEQKLREKLAQQQTAEEAKQPQITPTEFSADAPELTFSRNPEDEAIDRAFEQLDIVAAYNRWAKKKKCNPGNRRESIKVSCPNPQHPDRNPSCWLNRDKNVYFCAKCGGGDRYDIAAYGLGFPVPEYKQRETFQLLRHFIGRDLGVISFPAQSESVQQNKKDISSDSAPSPLPHGTAAPNESSGTGESANTVTTESASLGLLPKAIENEQNRRAYFAQFTGPTINWQSIYPENTFLHEWMKVFSG